MSYHQFFLDDQVLSKETDSTFVLRLSAQDEHHARVLRLCAGETIAVIDALTDYFLCEIVSFDHDEMLVRITSHGESVQQHEAKIVLAQGLAKNDKMDTIVRHCTEVGMTGMIPCAFNRSVVKLDSKKAATREQRWRSIAKSAAMQSGRALVPEVASCSTARDLCSLFSEATALLICWEEAPQTASISDALVKGIRACSCRCPEDVCIGVVIGPEGGLTEAEVDELLACNPRASLVSLGPSILRTETAAVVACALVSYELRRIFSTSREQGND